MYSPRNFCFYIFLASVSFDFETRIMSTCMSTSRSNYFDMSIWKKHADHSTTKYKFQLITVKFHEVHVKALFCKMSRHVEKLGSVHTKCQYQVTVLGTDPVFEIGTILLHLNHEMAATKRQVSSSLERLMCTHNAVRHSSFIWSQHFNGRKKENFLIPCPRELVDPLF